MKSSTKVIIKFQIFTTAILVFVLLIFNISILKLEANFYQGKINRIVNSHRISGFNNFRADRPWSKIENNCFIKYQQNYCLNNGEKILFGFWKIKGNYFYISKNIAFDVTDLFLIHQDLIKLSILILFWYVILSYPLGYLFLQTIYRKIFKAIKDLEEKNYIDFSNMKLSSKDELKILFETINKQIDTISSFNKYLSHELKTPLMNISSYLDILSLECDKTEIKQIKQELFRIKQLIDALNKLILLETKNYKLTKEEFDICEYIKQHFLSENIDLQCKGGLKITTSKELFSIVIKNLIENALKYSKGQVKIIVDENYFEIRNPSDEIKNLEKLTEKFYKEQNKGFGLGLFLVKKIVSLVGYKLDIKYENGNFIARIYF